MPESVNGLPLHPLLVHAVVVLVPLCALLLALAAVLPAARARLGVLLPLLAAVCLVLVPVTAHAGEQLEQLVGPSPLIEEHSRLADRLLPCAIALLVLSLAVWWLGRAGDDHDRADDRADDRAHDDARRVPGRVGAAGSAGAASPGVLVRGAVAVVALAVAVGTLVTVVQIGESGARAVWGGVTDSAS